MNNLSKKPEAETKVVVKSKKIFNKTASALSDDFFGPNLLAGRDFSLRFYQAQNGKKK